MLVRKLRLERGWSQETLAELSGLSVRTIQRLERGGKASLETLSGLAATFEISVSDLSVEAEVDKQDNLTVEAEMYKQNELTDSEQDALTYVRDIKGFYAHALGYVVANVILAAWNFLATPDYLWFLWCLIGWGMGLFVHGLAVFEVFNLFGTDWEKKQVEKRLKQGGRR
jgi:transcriptional regulator with XRE-family HTH domain